MDISWKDESKLQRRDTNGAIDIPEFTIPSADPKTACGRVKITATLDDQGTDIQFAFTPTSPAPEGCCKNYGWIQHITFGGWHFDNAASSGSETDRGRGADSDPSKDPQGSATGPRWTPNPWYGGAGNVTDERAKKNSDASEADKKKAAQAWAKNPDPQTTIRDHPGGDDGFVTQLVCVETGKIVFQYRWAQTRERGESQRHFVGSDGTNLTITP